MYLGIDVGTSSVKTVLLDDEGRSVAHASARLPISHPRPTYSEQDPNEWWRATVEAVNALPLALRAGVQAIGLCGQMHGATLLDARDRPLRPAILWNDARSATECVELEQRVAHARSITGTIVMPGFTAPKLLWIARHEPEHFRRTQTVLLPKDFVRLRLTGEKVSDMSDASGTAWLDVARRDWSDEMLEATGLARWNMPQLMEGTGISGQLLPDIARELQLPRVPVAAGAGDNAAGAVGLGVVAPGQATLSLGTSGVLFVVTDRFRPNPDHAAHAFCHCLPGRWHQMAVMLSAASVLDWVAQLVGLELESLIQQVRVERLSTHAPMMLPYLAGERTPHNDPHCSGVFLGLRPDTTPADLALAAMEGVALGLTDGLEVLSSAGGVIGDISISGGGARWSIWLEIIAAALKRPLHYRVNSEVGAAVGAARLARLALHSEPPGEVCTQPPLRQVAQPDEATADLLARRRPKFQQLYQSLRPVFIGSES